MKSIKYVLAAFLLSSLSQASNSTNYVTVLGPAQVSAPLIGSVTKTTTFSAPQVTSEALVTIKNGNGVDLSPTTCTGNVLVKLACQVSNALKAATVELTRPKDLVLTLNNQVVLPKTAYKPAVGEINLVIPLKLQNNIQVSFKGILGASITIQVKAPQSVQNQLPIASFQLSHAQGFAPLTISANAMASSDPDGSIVAYEWEFSDGAVATGPIVTHVILTAGAFNVKLTVTDNAGGKSSKSAQVNVLQNQLPIARLRVASNSEGYAPFMVLFEGGQSSDPEGQALRYFWNFGDGSAVIESDATISHEFKNAGNYNVVLTVKDSLGSSASASASITVTNPVLPVDPVTVAPDLSNNPLPTFEDKIGFLYQGENPIQKNVVVEKIDPKRVSALKGRVFNEDGTPLSGVTVKLLNDADMGETISRANGEYDFAFNSGANVVVSFEKNGYAKTQRQVDTKIQDYFSVEDVHLVKLDEKVTQVSMNSSEVQIAEGSKQQDADGERTGVLFFPPQTQAELVMPDGSRKPVADLNIRVTEYTVGANGPKRMPATLPTQTGYTYAAELSSDEAIALGADSIQFNKPVPYYVDNFLNIPVGIAVPVGFYDYKEGKWKGERDGVVLRIISKNAQGLAEVDLGKNRAANTEELALANFTDSELLSLANKYSVGTSLWRITTKHFSTIDLNYNSFPAGMNFLNDISNSADMEKSDIDRNIGPCPQTGCIIDLESRNLREQFQVPGSDIVLTYSSTLAPGRSAARSIKGKLTGNTISDKLLRVDVSIDVAGKTIKQTYSPETNLQFNFEWDGKDSYDRIVSGPVTAKVTVDYVAQDSYSLVNDVGETISWDVLNSQPSTLTIPGRGETNLSKKFFVKITQGNKIQNELSLNGWLLNEFHNYNPQTQTLTYGDGRVTNLSQLPKVYKSLAGKGTAGFSGDGGPANLAQFNNPQGIARGPDGSLYVADTGNNRIRKIDVNGIITTAAGMGLQGFGGDQSLAVDAQLNKPEAVAVDRNGNVYIADTGNYRIRKVGSDGIISTIAGSDSVWLPIRAYSADRNPSEAFLDKPNGVVTSDDGSIYISTTYQILRILPTGQIRAVTEYLNGSPLENIPAGRSAFSNMKITAIGSSGELYIVDPVRHKIRIVDAEGITRTVIGTGTKGHNGEFRLPNLTDLDTPSFVSVAPSGEIYFAEAGNGQVRYLDLNGYVNPLLGHKSNDAPSADEYTIADETKFRTLSAVLFNFDNSFTIVDAGNNKIGTFQSPIPTLSNNKYLIPSEDATEMFVFDQNGRHLQTLYGRTGKVKKSFEYDSAGMLIAVSDSFQNRTQFIRSGNSTVSQIVDPYGRITALASDSNGMLSSIRIPTGETTEIAYNDKGLMTSFKKPKGNISFYEYDDLGYLKKETNPQGGTQLLSQISNFVLQHTTGLGKTISVKEQTDFDGYEKIVTLPSGLEEYNTIYAGWEYNEHADKSISNRSRTFDTRTRGMGMYVDIEYVTTPLGFESYKSVDRKYTYNSGYFDFNLQEDIFDNGVSISRSYSSATKKDISTSLLGRVVTTTHDDWERPTEIKVGGLSSQYFQYDQKGRLNKVTQGDRVTEYNYDGFGNLASMTDALGRSVSFAYDDSGRITSQTSASGLTTYFAYDANSNTRAIKSPDRDWQQMLFGLLDFISEYQPTPGNSINKTVYTYSNDNEILSEARPDGKILAYNYEPATRRLASIESGDEWISQTYDNTNGMLKTRSRNSGVSINYQNDAFLLLKKNYSGLVEANIDFTYLTAIFPESSSINGKTISYDYDADRMLKQAGDLSINRNSSSGLISTTKLNNLTESYSYNNIGEIVGKRSTLNGNTLYEENYQRDKLGRIVSKTEIVGNVPHTFEYDYDLEGRLISSKKDGLAGQIFSYDGQGNRMNQSAQYDSEDRLLENSAYQYTYTLNGETSSKLNKQLGSTSTYSYSVFGHLNKVVHAGKTVEYIDDGEYHRVGKIVNGVVQNKFVYDQFGRIRAELDPSNQVVSEFIYATQSHSPDYMVHDGVNYSFIKDQLGSIRIVANSSTGAILQSISYDEYGVVLADSNPGIQPFGYAGGIYDHETGLVRFGAREYDAESGRWMTKDPLLFEGGDTNLYAYVGNDPINRIDPKGKDWTDVVDTANQFTAGAANSLSFGLSNALMDAAGNGSAVNKCSAAYKAGEGVATFISLGRLAYAGSVKVAAKLATNARAASATRNTLRSLFRLGKWGPYKSFAEVSQKYKGDSAEIIAASGRSSPEFNSWAGGAAITRTKCPCER